MTKKQRILIGAFYMLVPLVTNFLVMTITNLIDFGFAELPEYVDWTEFLQNHTFYSLITNCISFGLPGLFLFFYTLPIFFGKSSAKVHAANMPIVSALCGMTGWTLQFLMQVIVAIGVYLSLGVKIFIVLRNSLLLVFLTAVLCSSATFLFLETANRTKILPLYFPNGKIFGTDKLINPSLKFSFVMYYTGTAIFPIVMLSFVLFFDAKTKGFAPNWNAIIIALGFACLGVALTVLLVSLFTRPLGELGRVAKKISDGDFNDKVRVTSGDEIGALGDTFNDMSASLSEKEFMKDVFGKIVTPDVRDHLLNEGMAGIALGGENMNVTILFCDIRGFTTMSEKLPPEKVVQILNQYFSAMSECIMNHHGIINKYIGDAIMAIFGAPVKSGTHAMDAYLAALDMREALIKVNKDFVAKGFPEIRFGIGIHTGMVLAGNIGSSARMEYTVIGDSVNVASRIEGLCKEYKRDLLISESTVKEMESITTQSDSEITMPEFLCESAIRGKEEKIKLYSKA